MDYKDYYKILEISKDATQEDIKRAYRKLARKYHPDVNKDPGAELQFKEVGEAYEVLKDPEKRSAYDQFGTNWRAGQEFKPPPGWKFRDMPGQSRRSGSADHGFSDFFETLFGGSRGGHSSSDFSYFDSDLSDRGQDIMAKLAITLEDSYRGTKKTFSLRRKTPGESGGAHETTSLQVAIPQGILEGQQIRLGGQGDALFEQGRRGDLFLEVVFEQHPIFTIVRRDVSLTLPVAPWEVALGATVKVPTLGGPVDLKLPAGSQTGRKLRLKGRGLSSDTQQGDQYVVLAVHTPKATTESQRKFYQEMAREMPFNPRKKFGV